MLALNKLAYLSKIHRYLQRKGLQGFLQGIKSTASTKEMEKYTKNVTERIDTHRFLRSKVYHAKPHKSVTFYQNKAYELSDKAAKRMAEGIQKNDWNRFLEGAKFYAQGGHILTDVQSHNVKVRKLYPTLSRIPILNRAASPLAHWKHPGIDKFKKSRPEDLRALIDIEQYGHVTRQSLIKELSKKYGTEQANIKFREFLK